MELKKLNKTVKDLLNINPKEKGVLKLYNKEGNLVFEQHDNYWCKYEYNNDNALVFIQDSDQGITKDDNRYIFLNNKKYKIREPHPNNIIMEEDDYLKVNGKKYKLREIK